MQTIDMAAPSVRAALFCKEDGDIDMKRVMHELGALHIAFPRQVHGHEVALVRTESRGHIDADALVTDAVGLALCVFCADCQTFVVTVPGRNVLGVIHAGWRGMAQKILTAFYEKLRNEWNIRPGETRVYAGPSLCIDHAEFTDPHSELPAHLHRFVHGKCVDLRGAADSELFHLGVPADHVVRSPDCTACSPDKYWSVRAGNCSSERRQQPDGFATQRAVLCACLC